MSLLNNDRKLILVFLVGVRGSGKTTALNSFKSNNDVLILKPSTTRKKRFESEGEYYFTDAWNSEDYAWEIDVGSDKYGMLNSEIEKAKGYSCALTVFDPGSFEVLKRFRENTDIDVLTVGLDTIDSLDVQSERVGGAISRIMPERDFNSQRDIVRNCDVLMSGNAEEVYRSIVATVACLNSRGGVVQRAIIEPFLKSGVLLEDATEKVSPASYDLRLGDDVWCQGKFSTLSELNPVLKIPAYSYAIVSALELANLPCFISARFDLKNSLFFNGVILSNGPQIDPGYRGALFCMLYNGSDQPVGITRGTHFATIEFLTTSGVGLGYRDKYQGKTALKDFMPAGAAVSEGGKILERTEKKIEDITTEWKNFRNIVLVLLGLIVSPSLILSVNVWGKIGEYEKKIQEISLTELRLKHLEEKLELSLENHQHFEKRGVLVQKDQMVLENTDSAASGVIEPVQPVSAE